MTSDQPDPKAGERAYYAQIGEAGAEHVRGKPFSDSRRGYYLADMGAILTMIDPPPARILDLGCGAGWTSHFLARAGYTVTGVDISPDAIAIADSLVPDSMRARLTFRVGDYETNSEPGAFDYVLFYDALHHAEDEEAALRTAYAALKPGGALITLEPGRGHSQTSTSRKAVEQYGVHEKDMPPRHLLRLGRRIGFRRSLVLPLPHDLTRFVYRRDYFAGNPSPLKLRLEKMWGAFRVLGGLASQAKGSLTIQWR